MATVSVRYIVHDVDAAVAFYCGRLGFAEMMHPGTLVAAVARFRTRWSPERAADRLWSTIRRGTPSNRSSRPAPRLGSIPATAIEVHPIGHVESTLTDLADAPNQGDQGAPDAWLVIDPAVRAGMRDIAVGADLLVLTWLHHSRRDELSTVPGDDPGGQQRGVFSTRSPARPNPIGLHRVTVVAVENDRLRVRPLEAINGTPVVDIKPTIRATEA